MAYRHLGHQHILIQAYSKPIDGFKSRLLHLLSVKSLKSFPENKAEYIGLLPCFPVQHYVFRSGEVWKQGELLMDHAYSCIQSIKG